MKFDLNRFENVGADLNGANLRGVINGNVEQKRP